MSVRMGLFLTALVIAVAACQPLQRPFQPEVKVSSPDGPLALGPRGSLFVAPIAGAPTETSERLAALVAANLRDRDIPATTKAGDGESYRLEAVAEEVSLSETTLLLAVRWILKEPRGEEAGVFQQVKKVSAKDWASAAPALLALIAEQAAPRVDSMIDSLGAEPLPAPLAAVFVMAVDGAPGDGRAALTSAIRAALGERRVRIADEIGDDTYIVLGSVHMENDGPERQRIEVNWTLIEPSGNEIGAVSQTNTVPKGRLDGAWGPIAAAAADGGAEGIVRVLRRVGPLKKTAAGG